MVHEIIKEHDNPFINELKKMSVDFTDNKEYYANMYNLKVVLEFFPFRRFEQQDAHECIIAFLELLIKECPYKNLSFSDLDSWSKLLTSPFIPLFHGQMRNTIKCLKCQTVKNIFEEFNSINLNIPLENSNLTDLMIKYLEKEIHTDVENLYYCETCKTNERYSKKICLFRLPKVLIIVLKRYTFTGNKILSEVSFGNTLKIKETLTSDIKTYTLKSVINHTGNLYNGHYTNYIFMNGKCLFIDDENVKISSLHCKDAYVLFYES